MFDITSKTEKFLVVTVGALFFVLTINVFNTNPASMTVAFAESGSVGSESSSGSEDSEDSEDSGSSQASEKSEDNEDSEMSTTSTIDEASEASTVSTSSVGSVSSSQNVTPQGNDVDESGTLAEDSQVSEASVKSRSDLSEASEVSELSEKSVASVTSIDGFDEVVAVDGDVAIVKRNEKLFFLIPVEIESQVTLDTLGNVVDKKQSIGSWLLALLSF